VNRAGGRSGSLRNIGRIEQWNVGSGEGFRMLAGRDLCGRAEGRRPKAPQEGTRGGRVGGLPSMGIWRGGGLRRG
jgi:hypothetical protein